MSLLTIVLCCSLYYFNEFGNEKIALSFKLTKFKIWLCINSFPGQKRLYLLSHMVIADTRSKLY